MGLVSVLFKAFVIILLMSITLGYLSDAQLNMKVDENDQYETKAKDWLDLGIIVGWIIVSLIVIFCVMLFVRKGKGISGRIARSSENNKNNVNILIAICFIFYGVIAAAAAYNIKKGVNYEENKEYYDHCAWIAGIILGLAGVFIILWIYRKLQPSEEEKLIKQLEEYEKAYAANTK